MDRGCMPLDSCKSKGFPLSRKYNSSLHQEFISREICMNCLGSVELVVVPLEVGGRGPSAVLAQVRCWMVGEGSSPRLAWCPTGNMDTRPEPSTELPLYALQPIFQLLGVVVWHGMRLRATH